MLVRGGRESVGAKGVGELLGSGEHWERRLLPRDVREDAEPSCEVLTEYVSQQLSLFSLFYKEIQAYSSLPGLHHF
jgi:hypothetical protein